MRVHLVHTSMAEGERLVNAVDELLDSPGGEIVASLQLYLRKRFKMLALIFALGFIATFPLTKNVIAWLIDPTRLPEDVEIIDAIRKLLHDDGYTIKGAQKLLREQGVKAVVQQTYAIQNSNQDEKLKKSIGDILTNTEEISLNSIRDGLKAISDKLKNR